MPVSAELYEQVALADPEGRWELRCGRLVEKPLMAWEHNHIARELTFLLNLQLDRSVYEVVHDSGRLQFAGGGYAIPDLFVVPKAEASRRFPQPGMLESYADPVPLVVEVWSPSTGRYDVTEKLLDYQRRGDQEIWLIHPYDRTLTAWRRVADGIYTETLVRAGAIRPVALAGVSVELAALFE